MSNTRCRTTNNHNSPPSFWWNLLRPFSSWNTSVSVETMLRPRRQTDRGLIPFRNRDFALFSKHPDLLCGPHNLLSSVEIKCQLDATEVFIADLIVCSTCFGHHYAHHQGLKSIIQWLLPVVFRAVVFKLLVWCGDEGYVSGLQDAAVSCKPDT